VLVCGQGPGTLNVYRAKSGGRHKTTPSHARLDQATPAATLHAAVSTEVTAAPGEYARSAWATEAQKATIRTATVGTSSLMARP
jgi:hypothetical protein